MTGDADSNEFLSGNLNYLDDIKDVKTTKQRHSPKPAIIMALVVIGLSGGVLAMLSISNHSVENTTTADTESEMPNAQAQLSACIKSAQTNIEVDDPDFYPKLIASYKTQIDCYNRYDSENSSKKELEDKLSSVEVAARDAGISQAAIDTEYNRKAAQIEEEHRQYMAELDARGAREEAESQCRWEQMDAEAVQRKAEQAAQQAQYEAQKARCDAFNQKYGNQGGLTVAQNDAEVKALWSEYEVAQQQYQEASSALTGAIQSGYRQATIDYWQAEVAKRNSAMRSTHDRYEAALKQVMLNYERERKNACGY